MADLNLDPFSKEPAFVSENPKTGLPETVKYYADGNGLPYSKVPSNHSGKIARNIISWFIPEFGVIRMFVNPSGITYNNAKAITETRTKGGYTLQYWGETLTTLSITGTTGSSAIEGINMLYEMYRAEQYAFDAVGLTLAAKNSASDLASQLIGGIGSSVGGLFSPDGGAVGGGILNGLFGTDSPSNNLAPKNIMSLAQLAFGVEMYYNGWVYRGYFKSMTFNEKAENFLIDYRIEFVATQRRGYRVNNQAYHRTPNEGPSLYSTPNSFNGNKISSD